MDNGNFALTEWSNHLNMEASKLSFTNSKEYSLQYVKTAVETALSYLKKEELDETDIITIRNCVLIYLTR